MIRRIAWAILIGPAAALGIAVSILLLIAGMLSATLYFPGMGIAWVVTGKWIAFPKTPTSDATIWYPVRATIQLGHDIIVGKN